MINSSKYIQTVLGKIKPEDLGITTTHEHLFIDLRWMLVPPKESTELFKAYEPIGLDNLGWIRRNWTSNLDNLLISDEEITITEASKYKRAGGGTIVDATSIGIGRDPLALARVSRATNINVVMGASYYVDKVHPENMDEIKESTITQMIIDDITHGVGDTNIKAGIIGEIGCSWPLTKNETKVLRASAAAQAETGAAISIHLGRNEKSPKEIIEILKESGADLTRTIMGHLDRTTTNHEILIEIAENGCYLEYDIFGLESSYNPATIQDMSSDGQRIDYLIYLISKGYEKQIVIAQDICTKHRLQKYGGHGFSHIIENVIPHMIEKGMSRKQIDNIIINNPAGILAI